jgi:hypothetical protein
MNLLKYEIDNISQYKSSIIVMFRAIFLVKILYTDLRKTYAIVKPINFLIPI